MTLDLTLSPIYRISGQEIASLPGLFVMTPPQTAARGREKDRLTAYLLLAGNSVFSSSEYMQIAVDAANIFYQTPGALTTALRAATESVNKVLLERNMTTSAQGQYAAGWLTLAALRDTQCIISLSGPMHVHWFGEHEARHIHEPVSSGKGLGVHPNTSIHYAQVTLSAGDRMLFYGRAPSAWDSTLEDPTPSSFDAMRRRLVALTSEDLNAVLIQTTEGAGTLTLLKGTAELKEEKPEVDPAAPPPLTASLPASEEVDSAPGPFSDDALDMHSADQPHQTDSAPALTAHMVQPATYPVSYEPKETRPAESTPAAGPGPISSLPHTGPREFPASIPRIKPQTQSQPAQSESVKESSLPAAPASIVDEKKIITDDINAEIGIKEIKEANEIIEEKSAAPARVKQPAAPREPSPRARQTAKLAATGIQSIRRISRVIGERLKNFLPRLLPNTESSEISMPSDTTMMFMAILIPLMVVTIASVVYLRDGRSQQYETYLAQAQEMKAQAITLTNPVEQRIAWENVIFNVDKAEVHRQTTDTILIRQEAEANLDKLLGISRMQFNPVFSSNLGIEVSRMAASERDLFMLNAANGEVLRAELTNDRGFQLDTNFNCKPGLYASYTVGPLVDIIAMPALNSINATLLGIDATGNLLYCAPGQVAQAIPLLAPDTNWGRVTAFTMDGGNLYVLDAPARAVWVYTGRDGTFIDRPYFFFIDRTPTPDVIDLVISGDDLFMLHADGHLSTSSFNRIESVSDRYTDPRPLINPFAAYQDIDLFGSAHFTQILFTAPPDPSILLLDADTQGVLRFAPRSLELQNQFRPTTGTGNPIPPGPVGAVAVGPNHVLYLAVNGQVYFATGMP